MGTATFAIEVISESHVEAFSTILQNLPIGVIACNTEGRLLFSNPAAEEILGIAPAENDEQCEWGAVYGWYLPDEITLVTEDQLPLVRAVHGEEVADDLFFVRNRDRNGGVWIRVTGIPITNRESHTIAGVMVFRDVTQQQSPQSTSLLSQVVEQIADGVVLTDKQGSIQYVNPAFECITGFSRAEVRGKTPRVLKSGEHPPEFYRHLWGQLLEGHPFQGTILNRRKTGEVYHAEETITPIKDTSGQITHFVSVMNDVTAHVKKQEQDLQLRLAHQVQQQFYRPAPHVPGFDIAGAAYPAYETSGDYFDFIQLPHGALCIAVGDVEGHGFGSALVMALTRAYVRSFASLGLEIDQMLTQVNRMLVQDLGDGCFVTLSLACLDVRNRSVVYAGAGHVPGYVLSAAGDVEQILESNGLPLGLFPDTRYTRSAPMLLRPGQVILLLTDGVIESNGPGGTELGIERALDCVRKYGQERAAVIVENLYRAARAFGAGDLQNDDMTCVVVKVEEPGQSN